MAAQCRIDQGPARVAPRLLRIYQLQVAVAPTLVGIARPLQRLLEPGKNVAIERARFGNRQHQLLVQLEQPAAGVQQSGLALSTDQAAQGIRLGQRRRRPFAGEQRDGNAKDERVVVRPFQATEAGGKLDVRPPRAAGQLQLGVAQTGL